MRFSVIMPSILSDYPGAATGRDKKLLRAIDSVLSQSFTDFELIVVADGCRLTRYLVEKHYLANPQVKLLVVDHKGLFGNGPRNAGIATATGEYVIYLDNDDKWGVDHLKTFNDNINGEDWVYSEDWVFNGDWIKRDADPKQYGKIGTSNICHASRLGLRWKDSEAGYGHDYLFIQQLLKFEHFKQIPAAQYYVCHFSGGYQV